MMIILAAIGGSIVFRHYRSQPRGNFKIAFSRSLCVHLSSRAVSTMYIYLMIYLSNWAAYMDFTTTGFTTRAGGYNLSTTIRNEEDGKYGRVQGVWDVIETSGIDDNDDKKI